MDDTLVEYFGNRGFQNCGYCKGKSCKTNYGMWAHRMSCQVYQDLLDRGWRRSGKYCYKPIMNKTCCPQYTIRLDVTGAKLRKSQKKVIKCFNKYIATGVKPKPSNNNTSEQEELSSQTEIDGVGHSQMNSTQTPDLDKSSDEVMAIIEAASTKAGRGADPNKPRCKKAKQIRLENKMRKSEQQGAMVTSKDANSKKDKNREKTLEEWMEEIPTDAKIKFRTKTVRCCPESSDFKSTFKKEYEVYKKYQVAIHKDEPDDVTEKQFRRFLCEGPLIAVDQEDDDGVVDNEIPAIGLGAFHQQYYLDDRLVAVGVLDILPNAVSSKYFFYDPEFMFLSFGTYSALREIYFIRSLQCSGLKYYYMGFYIHSCQKMKYKGKFYPSYLLCPESYDWIPIEDCISKLDANKYSRLNDDQSVVPEESDINKTLILHGSQFMTFEIFQALTRNPSEKKENKKNVEEYTRLVGKSSQSMLLFRS